MGFGTFQLKLLRLHNDDQLIEGDVVILQTLIKNSCYFQYDINRTSKYGADTLAFPGISHQL